MKTERVYLALMAAALAMFIASCGKQEPKADAPAKDEKTTGQAKEGEKATTLSAEEQKAAGIETGPIQAFDLLPETTAYGRVLDPSTLGTAVADLTAAVAANETSQAEVKRLETLANENNASQRQLQAGKAASARDAAAVESAKLKIVSAWGVTLAERKDLGSLVTALVNQQGALIQLNLAADARLPSMPADVRIVGPDETNAVIAQVVSATPMVDLQLQGRGLLALVTNNTAHLMPGMAVTGYLTEPGEPHHGFLLPESSIVRYGGASWIYVQESPTNFSREAVTLQKSLTNGWFAKGDFGSHEKVVTRGAQTILSNELKSQVSAD
jgi:hypothetical protein